MKTAQAHRPEARSTDGETRREIMLLLLKHSPMTAAELGTRLKLSAAGVRRHLDILVEEGSAQVAESRPSCCSTRGRGRPAKKFVLTDQGRSSFGHDYDTLAADAIQALHQAGGEAAVKAFARQRIEKILAEVQPAADDEDSTFKTAQQIADALNHNGYTSEVQAAGCGVQICHHHCPISRVASQYPELCMAEYEALSELLGQHVQLLATITNGHGVCTTNIPLSPITHTSNERG